MTILEQIVKIYEELLSNTGIRLPHKEALDYFARLLMNGNIIIIEEYGELIGFLEFWKINFMQFGRVCCGITLAHDENLLDGNICLITRMYIKPDERNSHTFIHLASQLLKNNKNIDFFAAQQEPKKHKPLQVYTRNEVLKHYKI